MARTRIHNQTPVEIEEAVLARLIRGESVSSIGKLYGISEKAVRRIRHAAHLKPWKPCPLDLNRQPSPAEQAEIEQRMEECRHAHYLKMYRGQYDEDAPERHDVPSKFAREVTAELDIFGSGVQDCMGIECDPAILEEVRRECRREEKAKRKGRVSKILP